MNNANKLVNVIGGSGFIGTRLCQRLNKSKNYPFVIIDKAESVTFPHAVNIADVRSLDTLRTAIAEDSIIINLAAEHRDDVRPLSLYDEVNVDGARNICAVAEEKGVKTIIFTSTVAVYGFAKIGTDETGEISPFNDYGRTKFAAEEIFRRWQAESPQERTLVIIRPTVVFGERNRGNVYNLLKQIASGRFLMIGNGENRKSMAYVENIVAFIEFSIGFKPGVHLFNYIDKPDFTMNVLVGIVNRMFGRSDKIAFRLPYSVGYAVGRGFDLFASITGRRPSISSIRVKKFCSDSVFDTSVTSTGFIPPVKLRDALQKTIKFEFLGGLGDGVVFYSE
ncbi:NAD-dependent epimerase/dehydratase family protein [Undibacterium rugosum]|uniref:NAD-dependent epimerase/dehydratase family protein n=1 Tax=Undibacterium rugosum TaxID=2762291 RepID=UPI001B8368C4|nr:NAD-dependent epimerase/dehydratase family protein [Undibacterium rugosum]MBR7779961.1 NAD-dependent epimerase/dehydratase family protein [Undibacterium rugosum]